MKIRIIGLAFIIGGVFACSNSFSQVSYSYSPERPLAYSFRIDGDISYAYEGLPGQDFKVASMGEIRLEAEGTEDTYTLKLTPSKTLVEFSGMLLEDLTEKESTPSGIITTSLIKIKKNGEVLSASELTQGVLNLSQIFFILPAFPEKLNRPWRQTVPAFSLPGIPMCALNFNYTYSSGKKGPSKINMNAVPVINEKRKDGDVIVQFRGRDASKGEFIFEEEKGEIKSFSGVIDLDLNILFALSSEAKEQASSKQSIPLRMEIKLNVSLLRLDD